MATETVYVGNGRLLHFPDNSLRRFYLDANDLRSTPDIIRGKYERNWLGMFGDMIRKDDTVIDVGAHIGLFTVEAMSLVGENGIVIAFEPNTHSFRLLELNMETNSNLFTVKNYFASQLVVGDQDNKEVYFWQDKNFPTGSHVEGDGCHPERNAGHSVITQTKTLDSALTASHKVDVIKIDVEGAEYKVWLGMKDIIEKNKNLKLFIEVHRYAADKETDFLIMEMRHAGFHLDYYDIFANRAEPEDQHFYMYAWRD